MKPTKSRIKPTESDITNLIKCNSHRQSSKDATTPIPIAYFKLLLLFFVCWRFVG
ncbi:17526_t:CDS:2 [Gigaspora margarita]|uniref:17526_t:CDS:1 n=1 Tax=Gigaspora margarita TaxID=4874 RepID=A0ABN7UXP8_GIGMA|nr:17526_t:CDS:2 [Gigaspora margarita]